jgi:hypothetical protein
MEQSNSRISCECIACRRNPDNTNRHTAATSNVDGYEPAFRNSTMQNEYDILQYNGLGGATGVTYVTRLYNRAQ